MEVTVHNGYSILPTLEEQRQAAERVLTGLHTTLWGQAFNIIDNKDKAADWLAEHVNLVMREAMWPSRRR